MGPDAGDFQSDLQQLESMKPVNSLYGGATVQGCYHDNEDRFNAFPTQIENGCFDYYGVFDGHGGDEASKFVNSHLHFNIAHELENSDVSIDDALREAVLKTDDQFCSRATKMHSTAGVCLIVAVIRGRHLAFASVGDCGVMYHDQHGQYKLSCKRHCADDPDETARIIAAGGYVSNSRVMNILEPSRAIGDIDVREQAPGCIIADPDIVSCKLPSAGELHCAKSNVFIVLASDGVWDSVSLETVAFIVNTNLLRYKRNPARCEMAASKLVAYCSERTTDDVTAIVILFGL